MSELSEFLLAPDGALAALQTIEITHSRFSAPLRFVRNAHGGIVAMHGDDGPYTYQYLPMQIRSLGTTSSLDQSMEVTIGDVGEILPAQLSLMYAANGLREKPLLVYREYRSDDFSVEAIGAPDWTFDGTDDYIEMGDVFDITRTTPFSMSAWYTTTEASTGAILSKQVALDQVGWRWMAHSTKLDATTVGEDFILAGPSATEQIQVGCLPHAPTDGLLHHIVVTYDGSSTAAGFKFYVDNVLMTTVAQVDNLTSAVTTNSEPLRIGNRGSNLHWEGGLSHVSIWDKELDAGEVDEVYNGGTFPNLLSTSMASNLKGWWKLDEDDTDAAGGVIDHSTSGFDGTAEGGVGANSGAAVTVFQGPMYGPFTLQVHGLAFNKQGCTFKGRPASFNKARTGEIYDVGRFPMLVGFV